MNHVKKPICIGSEKIGNGGILEVPCGRGKCNGINTPIMQYDGTIKMVQDIKVGDIIMGDDSTPRRVLSLARGEDNMYDIIHSLNNKDEITTVTSSEITGAEKNKLSPTDLGLVVTDFLKLHFSKVMDFNFTAKIEGEFDEIAGTRKLSRVVCKYRVHKQTIYGKTFWRKRWCFV